MTNTNNELTDFQKKVFAEYELMKSFEKSSGAINKGRGKESKGCLFFSVFTFTDWFVSKILEREKTKRNYIGFAKEARELLRQKEISDRLCKVIADTNRKEILTEEKFVNELTAAFYQSDLASRFVIPENVVLYAMMAAEVYNIGLENFCNDWKGDE